MTGDSSSTQANQRFQREEKKNLKTFTNLIHRRVLDGRSRHGPKRVQSAAVRLQTKQLNAEIIQPKQSVMEV